MKRFLLLASVVIVAFISSGCATWEGVKEDSSKAWKSTKEAVHDATK